MLLLRRRNDDLPLSFRLQIQFHVVDGIEIDRGQLLRRRRIMSGFGVQDRKLAGQDDAGNDGGTGRCIDGFEGARESRLRPRDRCGGFFGRTHRAAIGLGQRAFFRQRLRMGFAIAKLEQQEDRRDGHDDARGRMQHDLGIALGTNRKMTPHAVFEAGDQSFDVGGRQLQAQRIADQVADTVDARHMHEDILAGGIEEHHPRLADIADAAVDSDHDAIFRQQPVGAVEIGNFLLGPVLGLGFGFLQLARKGNDPHLLQASSEIERSAGRNTEKMRLQGRAA